MHHVRLNDGREFGPADDGLLVQWARESRIPRDAVLVREDGTTLGVLEHEPLARILSAPPTAPGPVTYADGGDATGGLIPYKNPHALVGYYVAIAGLIFMLGLVASLISGITALVLGVMGLRRRKRDPRVRGAAHAWIAIIGGGIQILWGLGWGIFFVTIA